MAGDTRGPRGHNGTCVNSNQAMTGRVSTRRALAQVEFRGQQSCLPRRQVSVCLSVCRSVCLSAFLSVSLCLSLSVSLSVSLSMSVCLSVCLPAPPPRPPSLPLGLLVTTPGWHTSSLPMLPCLPLACDAGRGAVLALPSDADIDALNVTLPPEEILPAGVCV